MLEAGMNNLDSPGGNGRSSQPPRRRSSVSGTFNFTLLPSVMLYA